MAAAHDPSRRALLQGHTRPITPLRPPWALAEADFIAACTTCGACVASCEQQVLVLAAGGHPTFDPRLGECTFCGQCADACAPRALDRAVDPLPWSYRAMVGSQCLARQGVVCGSCADACPETAIRLRPAVPVAVPEVDAARCTGCGACASACPAAAIALRAASREAA